MQLLGLILLLASSWYLWKLTSNFLDEPTKKELTNSFNNLKNKFSEGKQNFSKEKISEAWENTKKKVELYQIMKNTSGLFKYYKSR